MRRPIVTAVLLTSLALPPAPAYAGSAVTVSGPGGNWAAVTATIRDGKLTVTVPTVTDKHNDRNCTWVILLLRLRGDADRRVVARWEAATNRNCGNRNRSLPVYERGGGVERVSAQLCLSPASSPPREACSATWKRVA
ncbi:hypothetical protein [Nonomuraea sp. NPDC003804]|uniref:hypothetical protein n=1 Tax=Nonomuraea sp. NPDC003804 TaxID=3154547 RepID=UPI0033B01A6D